MAGKLPDVKDVLADTSILVKYRSRRNPHGLKRRHSE
jgi:hypothetical protein